MTNTFIIFGTGPAAAFTLAAIQDYFNDRAEVTIIGREPATTMMGAAMFHADPAMFKLRKEIIAPKDAVHFFYQGSAYQYKQKQWGKDAGNQNASSSWGKYSREIVFQPELVLKGIWSSYPYNFALEENFLTDNQIGMIARDFDFGFVTFPTMAQRRANPSTFVQIPVMEIPYNGPKNMLNLVIYSGVQATRYVRESFLWGRCFREYPYYAQFAEETEVRYVPDMLPNRKPVLPKLPAPNLARVGRTALMDRNKLSPHVYDDVEAILDTLP